MTAFLHDLRYAARALVRQPGFAVVTVAVLALGIGANATMFSVVDGLLIRPLPFADAERLVRVYETTERVTGVERRPASYPDFADWRARSHTFESLAAVASGNFFLESGNGVERLGGEYVSGSYFSLLGVRPELGTAFDLQDRRGVEGTATAVVISHGVWTRLFGADRNIAGRAVRIDATPYTIVGVMGPGFSGVTDGADLWVPIVSLSADMLEERGRRGLAVVGRLKPDVTLAQASDELRTIARQLEKEYPDTNSKRGTEVVDLRDDQLGTLRDASIALLGAVIVVLLIACGNISNLLLARGHARERELAVRTAIGATRAQLARQLLAESLIVALAGAALGLLLAVWLIDALVAASPVPLPSYGRPSLNGSVLLFTAAIGVLTGLISGAIPALKAARRDFVETLKAGARHSGEGGHNARVQNAHVVVQVALSLALLAAAGLLVDSFRRLAAVPPGFDARGVASVRISLVTPTGDEEAALARIAPLLDRVRALPGVRAASLSSDFPLDGSASAIFYTPEVAGTDEEGTRPRAYVHRITPDFFRVSGIPVVKGRTFHSGEMAGRSLAVIVSEEVARRYWPGQNVLGKRLKPGGRDSQAPWLQIVGVVGDVKYRGLPTNPTPDPDLYLPAQPGRTTFTLAARTTGEPTALVAALGREAQQFDPAIAVYGGATLGQNVETQLAAARFSSLMMGLFGALALLLAMVGIYGTVSYGVTRRRHEIGVRMALGASRRTILRMVAAQTGRVVGVGVVIGVPAAFAAGRLLETLLYDVRPGEPLVLAVVCGLLATTGVAAALLPARRAARVNPVAALRHG
jgi:putative ABC transport system permease protein